MFIVFDIISLAVQTVGGVQVSSAKDYQQLSDGAMIMRGGIIFQFSNTIVFVVLLIITHFRLRNKAMTMREVAGWPVMAALYISTGMIFVRNGYRIAELTYGWKGRLVRTEAYLLGLDMGPMVLAVGALVVFAPSIFLERPKIGGGGNE
jgi:hypothetical protein